MAPFTLLAALATLSLAAGSVVKTPSNDGTFELLILHNNDMHARFEQTSQLSGACTAADRDAGKCYGGFPRVAHVVKEARKAAASGEGPPVLYLNAGDTYTGTAWFTIYKWKIAAEFLNALKPDAVSLGNHEFDNGVSGLTPFIENLSCPVLAANLILNKVPELENEANLKKSLIFNIDGVKVGVIGYLTPDTKVLAVHNDVEYVSEIIAIKEEVTNLQNEGVNIIIALGHSGYSRDLEIAREVEGLDLVIGGHTNTFLWNGTIPDSEKALGPYPMYVEQASGKQVPVVQAYAYTKYLGRLHMILNKNGEAVSIDGSPILLDASVPQNADVLNIMQRYKSKVLNISEEIVGNTSTLLDGFSCKRKECNLGNLITDAMLDRYAAYYSGKHWTDTAIAMINGGSIRASIVHANLHTQVTKGDILSILPFEERLVILTMTGRILLEVLEHSVFQYDQGGFMQFAGIKVVYNVDKPAGSRVVSAKARCAACDIPAYYAINEADTYKVMMSEFLSNGGDGYKMLKGLPLEKLHLNGLMSIRHYIRHHSPVHPKEEGRITILGRNIL